MLVFNPASLAGFLLVPFRFFISIEEFVTAGQNRNAESKKKIIAVRKFANEPAAKILSFSFKGARFTCLSSGSTKAPGKIVNNKSPTDFNLIFCARAITPCINSCGIKIAPIVKNQNQNGM